MRFDNNFKDLYDLARQHHPSIIATNDNMIQRIENELQDARKAEGTIRYIVVTISAIFFFATYPFLIVRAYLITSALEQQLAVALSQREFINNHPEAVIAAIFVFAAAIIYTLLPPSFRITESRRRFPPGINRRSIKYITYTVIVNYSALILPLLFLYSYIPNLASIIKWITIVWLMAPAVIICTLPTLALLFILALTTTRPDISKRTSPAIIIYELLKLLSRLDGVQDLTALSHNKKRAVVSSIDDIAIMIRTLYQVDALKDAATLWSVKQMHRASDNFLSLGSWVYFPQPNTLESLKARICSYLNIFLSGNYHDLPREELGEQAGMLFSQHVRGFRKVIELLSFAVYMAAPIAAFSLIIILFHIDIPPLIQSALTLLYIIWAIFGFFSFSERLAPDARTFLTEVIKSFIQRK